MIDIKDKIDQEENEQLRSIPAQRLIEKLSLLKNRIPSATKRWFWELLQNASDYNKIVNIKLVVSDQKVTFSHDGAPFSLRDALNIISPDSNKQDDLLHKDNIGKFGTGLVSTHILSAIMDVEGICLDNENNQYHFSITLDRSCFNDKKALIQQITEAKESLKSSLQESLSTKGFQTSFSYRLDKPLPTLPRIESKEIDLNYLYTAIPYTLCFMPKVQSVEIEDRRDEKKSKNYYIRRLRSTDQCISFEENGQTVDFAHFIYKDTSSVFLIKEGAIVPFPSGLSKIFCGLPLIGTEDVGLPFLLNSLNFEPTTEREGVELEPTANETNRKLFKDSVALYQKILQYIVDHKLKKAFCITNIGKVYHGTQASRQQFQSIYLREYKKVVLDSAIVVNTEGSFIPFSNMRIPQNKSKKDHQLYDNISFLLSKELPLLEDYEDWLKATDFSIFDKQQCTYETLAEEIQSKKNIYSFGGAIEEVKKRLLNSIQYIKEQDGQIFSKKRLLPNQEGDLEYADHLYYDNELPQELKDIYNKLHTEENGKVEEVLLDREFNSLNIIGREYTLEKLCRNIDQALAEQFSKNMANTASISTPLNTLYTWINQSDIEKSKLSNWFHWYYPKRATLIVDMLDDSEREQALLIAQSGKMDVLAELSKLDIPKENLYQLIKNRDKLSQIISLLSSEVDDTYFADKEEGDIGEEIVFKDLQKWFPKSKGYRVVWSSREENQASYDFVVQQGDKIIFYCDAKTTRRGIANADSIPFFMRQSQWSFLEEIGDTTPYVIARVFMRDNNKIKYMRVTKFSF